MIVVPHYPTQLPQSEVVNSILSIPNNWSSWIKYYHASESMSIPTSSHPYKTVSFLYSLKYNAVQISSKYKAITNYRNRCIFLLIATKVI